MTEPELEALLRAHPVLFHAAEAGAWPSIAAHGLLGASALLDLYGVTGPAREALEARRRPEGVPLAAPGLPGALLRDQKPMDDAGLRRCLRDGLTPEDWYRVLNGRVFFWLTRARLERLLAARPYRALAHVVVEVDAASLVAAHRERIALSPINSGTTKPYGAPRGLDTFLPVAAYPYAHWSAKRGRGGDAVVELTVAGGVPDIARHALRVVRRRGPAEEGVVWTRG